MMGSIAEVSPLPKARITGVVYLLYFLTAISAQVCMRGLIASGDAAATAINIQTHEPLFRLGMALGLIAIAWYVVLTALLYDLFTLVNRSLSLLAAFFSLVGCAVQAFASLFQLAPSVVLAGSPYLGVFKLEQLQGPHSCFSNLALRRSTLDWYFSDSIACCSAFSFSSQPSSRKF